MGFAGAHVTKWKNGSVPTDLTLLTIAEHFGLNSDYFDPFVSPNEAQKEKSSTPEGVELDAETIELLEAWNSGDEAKEFLLSAARMIKARRKNGD